MTTATLSWAWSQDMKPTHKLVLMAIADGIDWNQPWEISRLDRIAQKSGIPFWKVQPIIDQLANAGYLKYVETNGEPARLMLVRR